MTPASLPAVNPNRGAMWDWSDTHQSDGPRTITCFLSLVYEPYLVLRAADYTPLFQVQAQKYLPLEGFLCVLQPIYVALCVVGGLYWLREE
jgi:hypothetical protein